MTAKRSNPTSSDADAPYGTRPRRSRAPLLLLAALYACWLIVLLWMAVAHVGE